MLLLTSASAKVPRKALTYVNAVTANAQTYRFSQALQFAAGVTVYPVAFQGTGADVTSTAILGHDAETRFSVTKMDG